MGYYQVVFIPACVQDFTEKELLPKGFAELEPLKSKVGGCFCFSDSTKQKKNVSLVWFVMLKGKNDAS